MQMCSDLSQLSINGVPRNGSMQQSMAADQRGLANRLRDGDVHLCKLAEATPAYVAWGC